MNIHPFSTTLMKYKQIQSLAEFYYRRKVGRPCFIMRQNERWTLVTLEM